MADRLEIGLAGRQEMADRLSRASLAVLLSEFESQPLAALEAASLGSPSWLPITPVCPSYRDGASPGLSSCDSPDVTPGR